MKSRTTSAGKETENARKSSEEERAADLEDSNGDQSEISTETTSEDKFRFFNVNKLARLSKVITIAQEVPVSRIISNYCLLRSDLTQFKYICATTNLMNNLIVLDVNEFLS